MNNKGLTIAQIIALLFIAFVIIIVILVVKNFPKQEKVDYLKYKTSNKPEIVLNGSYVEYAHINTLYEDKGASATSKSGKNISNYIIKTIYKGDRVVTSLDTSDFNTYKINYTVTDPDNNSLTTTISRVVIVIDDVPPKINLPKTQTITSSEVLTYDLEAGVTVTDNWEKVSLTYNNPLKPLSGDYIVTYKAIDKSGNKAIRKRLIKVIDSIDINEENNKLVISFPDSPKGKNYTYKYSLDNGNTWLNAKKRTKIDINNVIAVVFEGDNYVMSMSYQA